MIYLRDFCQIEQKIEVQAKWPHADLRAQKNTGKLVAMVKLQLQTVQPNKRTMLG